MSIEIVAIGNEVLTGMIVNSNAAFIGAELMKAGWQVVRHTVLPDDPQLLERGLREALERADLVITTGGLGPTCDDITRTIACKIFNSELRRDAAIAADLEKRYGNFLVSLEDQALAPTKAKRLPNRVGSASGWLFSEQGRSLALLPGPPSEMSSMLTEALLPQISPTIGLEPQKLFSRTLHLCCLREDDVDPLLRLLAAEYPEVNSGIYPGYGMITVRFSGREEQALRLCVEALTRDFSTYLLEAPQEKIEEAVHAWFKHQGKTLAFAESCTGGKMAAQITALPGASDFFLGSIVAYANQVKIDFLGVSEETLRTYGAVSAEAVQEMLEGVFKTTGTDWAIAVSGIAGPMGGLPQKPVGTIWAALGERGKPADIAHMYLPLSRDTIITVTANRLLGALYRKARFGIACRSFEK